MSIAIFTTKETKDTTAKLAFALVVLSLVSFVSFVVKDAKAAWLGTSGHHSLP